MHRAILMPPSNCIATLASSETAIAGKGMVVDRTGRLVSALYPARIQGVDCIRLVTIDLRKLLQTVIADKFRAVRHQG